MRPDGFVKALGLGQSLTPSRTNAFLKMLKLMQCKALALSTDKGMYTANPELACFLDKRRTDKDTVSLCRQILSAVFLLRMASAHQLAWPQPTQPISPLTNLLYWVTYLLYLGSGRLPCHNSEPYLP